jgi:hypothetical protein
MPHIYPPAPPTISGDTITISRFLQAPQLVQRRIRDIALNRFISDVLLQGRYETSGGSVLYEQTESQFTDAAPEAVAPGGQYPRASATPGPAALAAVTKWGEDVPITDEHVKRYGRRAMDVAFLKITNYLVKQVDSISLTAIGAAVTQSQAVVAAWNNASRDILLDLMLAQSKINGKEQGYSADTVVTTDEGYARIVADRNIIAGLARERGVNTTVTETGEVTMIAGLRILATNYLPSGVKAMVVDSSMLGGIAYERLESPEYDGDPANGVETWARRDPNANDQWLVRGRRPMVPLVQEPEAGCLITGTALS